ncbi:MAG TPA: HEAT repeat domain-containing protein [Gemmatimonadales bacterium]|nr:HEAT repeat domain-containing protein [Gemmatimonadales bacterium]
MIATKMFLAAGALSALLAVSGAGQGDLAPQQEPATATAAPAPWLAQDPGDSLYRAGRNALNRSDYRTAARQFRSLRERYPRSGYAGDAYYWEAFALSKLGGTDGLRTAVALLDRQAERYAEARTARDGRELRARIQGELASMGDAASAAAVAAAVAPLAPPAGVPPARAPAVAPPVGPTPAPPVARGGRGVGRGAGRGQGSECREEDDERVIALQSLINMDAERALPILRQVLQRRDDGSVCLRRQAVFLISQKRSPETARILLDAARNDPDAEVRENSVFWLSQVDLPEAVAALDSILQHGADRDLQEKAVFALSQQRGEESGRALRAHLERAGTPDDIKEHIIFWLGQKRSSENAQYLKDFYAKTSDGDLKEKVLFSLSQMNLDDHARWLIGIAQNES